MIVGYAQQINIHENVSKLELELNLNGCSKCFIDDCKNTFAKPELENLLEFIREGDTIKIYRIEDFGTTARFIIMNLAILIDKGVNVEFINNKTIAHVNNGLKEFIRTLSNVEKQRKVKSQAEGIAKAKDAGKYKGRPKREYDYNLFVKLYNQWKNGEIKQAYMMKQLNVSRATLARRIKDYEAKQLSKKL